jgi:tRNA modification GTPase
MALKCAATLFRTTEQIPAAKRRCYSGHIHLSGVASPLPADLHHWPAPRTYTGQDLVEIHTWSCPPLVDVLIADLLNAGARAAQPGEFTLRAFLGGKLDLAQVEAVLAVIEANGEHELKQALTQLAGGLTRPMQALRDDLLNLLADVEAGLDFVEEGIHFVGSEDLLTRISHGMAHLENLRRQLEHRSVPDSAFRVVLAGRTNAGKSSLFNALVENGRALVSAEPGTTRDYLSRRLEIDGVKLEIVDTAGWRETPGVIEEQAQSLGREQTTKADLVLWCIDATQPLSADSGVIRDLRLPAMLQVHTKCDLAPAPGSGMATSVLTGAGISALRKELAKRARQHAQPALAPSLSRCRHHVLSCLEHLRHAYDMALNEEPRELLALVLRSAVNQLGEIAGAVYTDDLLDRIFSRFCIGK